jgi:glycosyltransferase involved in cell wall biosynthesis
MRRELEALVRELGVDQDVSLPGFTSNPFAYMARAAVFVLSSTYEGFGNVLVEAMSCGCPVVSTDCPSGPDEILDHGKYGRLAPVGDPIALAEAIVLTMESPPDRRMLQERAAAFSVDRAAEQYLKILFDEGGHGCTFC